MKIINLDENELDNFAKNHKYRNFYQSSSYGKVMTKQGFEAHYFGFTNNNDELVGATLILYKEIFLKQKYAYCPSGFLIDYTDLDFLKELTDKLKQFLYKNGFVYFKIDPPIHCSKRDSNGEITSYNPEINNILNNLQVCGYKHTGFNKYFENRKCRFNAVLRLSTSNERLFKNLSKNVRNKINKANKSGIVSYKASKDELPIFYEFIKDKHNRTLEYYKDMFDAYGDNIELYLTKIDPYKFVKYSKEMYELELAENEKYSDFIQENSFNGTDLTDVINKKMESDKALGDVQSQLTKATNLVQSNPDGIIVGGVIIIKQDTTAYLLIEGFDKKYRDLNSNYYLKWDLIKKFNQEEYQYFNMNAVVGEFLEPNPYSGLNEMKLGYNTFVIEYIGEFDYIVNEIIYNLRVKNLKRN